MENNYMLIVFKINKPMFSILSGGLQREETAGNSISEDMDTGIEDEGEGRTEERTEICAGTRLMATNAYTKNQESPIGKEIDLQQWDTLIFKGEHADNENWSLVQDRTG